ncbi:tripartite tricarboxylate transporter substrate binding protein [Pigmentiphaga sp. GD03639]|uniref:Bug family tripartite tricarboxylate transporter substrate binding protein n=1 Tax=unclassified Pigmentiphaga TaxID=2626614 RepID=UPI001053E731|nr:MULTISPECIES: tripartite tricarboxylate transporter substrate binding protein [unclassified Pigmentiphaga]MDH2235923.1 tripartite tricarboxylate transporter substrate binding protein [Pigmentiphaga sp. GD03639]
MPRRALLAFCISSLCLAAHADTYPSRNVTLVVTSGPGSSADILSRIIGVDLSRRLGHTVVVDNRPGAGGNIAGELVAKAPADGHTLLLASISTHGINPWLYARMPFDPVKDFKPIGTVASNPNVLVVAARSPIRSIPDLLTAARKTPDLAYSSGGSGTSQHLAGEMFASRAGIKLMHVPYKSAPQSMNAVLAGDVAMTFLSVPVAAGQIQAGQLRALGLTSARRLASLPDVPSIAEQGLPGFDVSAWFGLVAPAGTPQPVVDQLNRALQETLREPSVREKLEGQGMEILGGTPEEFARLIRSEIDRWGPVVRASGAAVN